MRFIIALGDFLNTIYNSLKFKSNLKKALRNGSDKAYLIQTQSDFTYEDTELIIYDIHSKESSNIFYVFLPFSTRHTRLVAHVNQEGILETRSFYGKQLHATIAKFMFQQFGDA